MYKFICIASCILCIMICAYAFLVGLVSIIVGSIQPDMFNMIGLGVMAGLIFISIVELRVRNW